MSGLNAGQRRVADDPAGRLFVAAGAGSGKTRALAWRYAQAALGGGPRAADRAVAITFTEKAAGELAERIRRVLLERGDKDAARSVDSGWISTIHGLSARLLRRHALLAGIDPRVPVASEIEEGMLKERCFEETSHALSSTDEGVARLLADMGVSTIRTAVVHGAARLRAMRASLADIPDPMPELGGRLTATVAALEAIAGEFGELPSRTKTTEDDQEACAALSRDLAEVDPDSSRAAFEVLAALESFKVVRRGCEELKELCSEAESAIEPLAREAASVVASPYRAALLRLMGEYSEAYSQAKEKRGLLDFDDLVDRAAGLVTDHPSIAETYARRFDAFMVDEFQDTDPVQASLVDALAGGRLCTVGDEQQAIYGWRFADIEVFRARREAVALDERVELDVNYRSHPAVLDFVNEAFGDPALFGEEFLRLEAARERGTVAWPGPRIEMIAVESRGWEGRSVRQVETAVVSERVSALVEQGVPPGDIAVLMRSMAPAVHYAAALREAGIPTFVERAGPLGEHPEIEAVLDGLRAIANIHDEEALTGFLAGPMVRLDDVSLLALHTTARSEGVSLWEVLGQQEGQLASGARRLLEDLRERRGRSTIEELILALVSLTDLDLLLSAAGPEGEQALSRIYRLARVAQAHGSDGPGDVAGAIEAVRLRDEHVRGEAETAAGTEGIDAVRLMTVHAAKGLEFPVVVVPEMGRKTSRSKDTVLLEKGPDGPVMGIRVPALPDEGLSKASATGEHVGSQEARLARETAEEKRVLYVACTRAEEALILVGSANLDVADDRSPIGWLRSAWPSSLPDVQLTVVTPGDPIPGDEAMDEGMAGQSDQPPTWRLPDGISSGGISRAPEPPRDDRPRTVSYTALGEFAACPYRYHASRVAGLGSIGDALSGAGGVSAAQLGSAVHALLSQSDQQGVPEGAACRTVRAFGIEGAAAIEETAESLLARPAVARAMSGSFLTEVPFAVALGETLLVGSLDLIGREGTAALVVDYKTGTPSEDADRTHGLQARCYALAALEGGCDRVEVVFVYPEGPDASFEFTDADMGTIRAGLEETLGLIASGERTPRDSYDEVVCGSCPAFRATCPVSGPRR